MLLWDEGLSPNFLRLFASAYRHFKILFPFILLVAGEIFLSIISGKNKSWNNCDGFLLEIEDVILRFSFSFSLLLARPCVQKGKNNHCDAGDVWGIFWWMSWSLMLWNLMEKWAFESATWAWTQVTIQFQREMNESRSVTWSCNLRCALQTMHKSKNGWDGRGKSWDKSRKSFHAQEVNSFCVISLPPVNLSIKTWARERTGKNEQTEMNENCKCLIMVRR